MDEQQSAYIEEANELLAELEESLLELEEEPGDMDVVGRVFRAMHTIKGSGAMFGFDDIADFTHGVETVYDLVREGSLSVSKDLINLSLAARDQIKAMLDSADGGEAVDEEITRKLAASFKAIQGSGDTDSVSITEADPIPVQDNNAESGGSATYRIRFKPAADIFKFGTNPIHLINELREFGECSVVPHNTQVPELEEYDPESCYTFWDIVLTTEKSMDDIRGVFIFVEDDCELQITIIDEEHVNGDAEYKKLGEILVERGDILPEALQALLGGQKRIGEMLVEAEAVNEEAVASALAEQQHVNKLRKNRQEKTRVSSVRVDSDKLDALVDLVGELVTLQARLTQRASVLCDPELTQISEDVESLTEELRDNTMSTRMLPIGTTFNKFKRLVRDLSSGLGKEISLTTEGAETELDKTVIDQLNDPMVHLIRNCIDHGIELPEIREQNGKPREGTVHLSAIHSGAYVLIEITDDGAGLDVETIRQKAVSKGLITADDTPTDQEIYAMIFAAGFSTAKTVTDVSGRGVGMDVVKRGIEALRGTIEVDSKKGHGTTITLKLPLTLAIIDGLLVEVGDVNYVMPLAAVEECVELSREEALTAQERSTMTFRGEIFSYLSLREQFDVPGELPEVVKVVIAEAMGDRICFAVDQVIGQHQTVIKSISKAYKNVEEISGATIMGDGTIALIVDVQRMVQAAIDKNNQPVCKAA